MMIKYRTIIKIGYYEAWYEFDDAEDAVTFAKTLLEHQVDNEDSKKKTRITLQVVDTEAEKMESEED